MPAATIESHNYSYLIGTELTVGYADQSESFASYLPRTGTVMRQITLDVWAPIGWSWALHAPFDYQLGSLETGLRAAHIVHFVVRSRWHGHPIGAADLGLSSLGCRLRAREEAALSQRRLHSHLLGYHSPERIDTIRKGESAGNEFILAPGRRR